MKERPILFSGPMVRAIIDGRKSQTRRVSKWQDIECLSSNDEFRAASTYPLAKDTGTLYHYVQRTDGVIVGLPCPYGRLGDRLWVRENGWQRPERTPRMMREGADTWKPYYYDADITEQDHEQFKEWGFKRRPSIHMPRRFCRVELEIVAVRLERLQWITEDDAKAEGAKPYVAGMDAAGPLKTHRTGFVHIWQSINGTWLENPWVWVVTFKRAEASRKAA